MKPTLPLSLAFLGAMATIPLQAAVIAEWTFNTGATSAARLSSSNVAAGVTVSSLQMNSSGGLGFRDFGVGALPSGPHDGFGFGQTGGGEEVMFTDRAEYFDGSSVPSPKPTTLDYTSFGPSAQQGTSAGLGNGNAPISFTVAAGLDPVRIDSLFFALSTSAPGQTADLILTFQEAGAAGGAAVTANSGSGWSETALLNSPILISAGQTRTFTMNLNSGALNSRHNLDQFTLNGQVVPEPSTTLLSGLLGVLALMRRRRQA